KSKQRKHHTDRVDIRGHINKILIILTGKDKGSKNNDSIQAKAWYTQPDDFSFDQHSTHNNAIPKYPQDSHRSQSTYQQDSRYAEPRTSEARNSQQRSDHHRLRAQPHIKPLDLIINSAKKKLTSASNTNINDL
ncbi:unnamed protein product, partial [Candida parapsilosis]